MNIVGRMDRNRQLAFLCCARCCAHQVDCAGLNLTRYENAADAIVASTLLLVDEVEREFEFTLARSFVDDPIQPAVGATDPAPAVEAGPEVGANTKFLDLLQQCFLNLQLATKFHECRDSVAQQLCYGEPRIESKIPGRRTIVGTCVTRIAADPRSFPGDADFEERLTKIVGTADV